MFRLLALSAQRSAATQLGPALDRWTSREAPSASRGANVPQISFNPTNQCTLDDPSDGADLPSLAPNSAVPSGAASAAREPSCQAPDATKGGAPNDECTDALVRRFSAEGAAQPAAAPKGGNLCPIETLATAVNCGKVVAEVMERQLPSAADAINCLSSIKSLVTCATE
jgi:hypothetical protein